MKRYPAYKDSGIRWIGEIPDQWDAVKIKWLSPVKRGASPRPIDDPKYFDEEGEFAWVRIADVTASERYLERTTQTLSELGSSLSVKRYPGDLFLSIAGTVGKPIIAKIKCCIHDGFVYFPLLETNPELLFYMFSSGQLFQGLGKWGTQLNLNTETVGDIYVPQPSDLEIEAIVKYLDHKTYLIDTLIEKKQNQIELLQEQRAAIINQAVTKGLNPNFKMKDSGIEWLGEVPEHWNTKRLKYIAKIRYGLGQPPRELEGGLPLIRATNVKRGQIVENGMIYIDPEDVPYDRDPVLKKNDIIVVRSGAYTADSAIIPEKYAGAITGYDMVVTVQTALPRLVSYALLSNYVLNNQLFLQRLRAAQPHLNAEELGETFILLPSDISEQKEILDYIEAESQVVDSSISKAEKQIELLKEYRTTLISEVVTGKIDVRDEAIP